MLVFPKTSHEYHLGNQQTSCMFGNEFVENTKYLFRAYADYCVENGFEACIKNGFSPQNFKKIILTYNTVFGYSQYGYDGHMSAYTGIRLKDSKPKPNEVVKEFIEKCCIKSVSQKTKSVDLFNAFEYYAKTRYTLDSVTRPAFFKTFREQNPEIIDKTIGKLFQIMLLLRKCVSYIRRVQC